MAHHLTTPGGISRDRPPTTDAAIVVDHVSKRYTRQLRSDLRYGFDDIVADLKARPTTRHNELRDHEFWAVEDVSFTVEWGEVYGVLGTNGAGKSTLLRMIAGITSPDEGSITVSGRVGQLLDPVVHLNPLMTGRENVLASTTHAGMTRRQIHELVDWAEDFADIGEAFDYPVRHYSQGMRLRVGFSAIAGIDPDILLIDEALGVGDVEFRQKCGEHVFRHVQRGGAVLLVSHSVFMIGGMCRHATVLDRGRVFFTGPAREAADTYLDDIIGFDQIVPAANDDVGVPADNTTDADTGSDHSDADQILARRITDLRLEATNGGPITTGCDIDVELTLNVDHAIPAVYWAFLIWTQDQQHCLTSGTSADGNPISLSAGVNRLRVRSGPLALMPGTYFVKAAVVDTDASVPVALHGWYDRPTRLDIAEDPGVDPVDPLHDFSTIPLSPLEVEWDF